MGALATVRSAIGRALFGKAFEQWFGTVTGNTAWSWSWPIVREPFPGAWQRNETLRTESVIEYWAVYACVTLIANDIAKLGVRLVEKDENGIPSPIQVAAFSPVLRKPNRYQGRISFFEQWVVSKLLTGNTYVLKERDDRQVVRYLHVLDPCRTRPLVAPDGSVFYQIYKDALAGVEEDSISVPASEIIHDVMAPLYHPLCGVSPLIACGLAAVQGLAIQRNSARFFENNSQPGGILTAPGHIDDTTALRLKNHWEQNYSGENVGKIVVLGDNLKFESLMMKAADSQLVDQAKLTAEVVCSAFHVPPYMIGAGQLPTYNNVEALNQQYYTQCLQVLIEAIELLLDEGLGLTEVVGKSYGVEFDLDDLLRMDTATKVKSWGDLVKAGIAAPDEGRKRFNLKPTEGGDTPYLQQQNYSLAALSKRDSQDDPFANTGRAPAPVADEPDEEPEDSEDDDTDRAFALRELTRSAYRFHARSPVS